MAAAKKAKTEKMTKEALEELKNKLSFKRQNAYAFMTDEERAECDGYAEDYIRFLNASKTGREAVKTAVAMAEKEGFREWKFGDEIKAKGKYYFNNRGKALYLFVRGTEKLAENGVRITAAHIDSPRIDLKAHPLYEDSGLCLFKTQYYGGIKKYQWTTIPLALHGTIVKKDGTTVEINIGEDPSDPVFCITDLLPHFAKDQMAKTLADGVSASSLNIVAGSLPLAPEVDENSVKLGILSLLNETYGITEEDFISADISAVPAWRARYVGFDASLIGGYGHDDRVCAYPVLTALLDAAKKPKHTVIGVLADKEETGSEGMTGMQSEVLCDIIDAISAACGADPAAVRNNSMCLSADVSAAFDPSYPEAHEKTNASLMNYGVSMLKYTGSRGKSSTNEATAEFVGKVRAMLDGAHVLWQASELGKTDLGGGGTVAKYVSVHNIDTVDVGVPMLSMHAPFELVAKADVYMTHRAMLAFNL